MSEDAIKARHGLRRPSACGRRLRLEVVLDIDQRVVVPDAHIVTGLTDAIWHMDRQDLLFPGVTWPPHPERLWSWEVRLTGSGRRSATTERLERAMEARRAEGDVWPRRAPRSEAEAALQDEAEAVVAAIDHLEPELLKRAGELWTAIERLRHVAARVLEPDASAVELRAAVAEARDVLKRVGSLSPPAAEPPAHADP
ncbi:hypothetical protein [Falsiroseomonas oryziterrae]|uniref:hypothetical protein n=1 Tax=Falsiroseomonas oryziterrae TaxID=2911368 RepID=UPI001F3DF2B9|nr:hypothetical protein [Roseomonas sp. NPKOSM-4]